MPRVSASAAVLVTGGTMIIEAHTVDRVCCCCCCWCGNQREIGHALASYTKAARRTSSLRSDQPPLAHFSSISCTVAPGREGEEEGCSRAWTSLNPHPPLPSLPAKPPSEWTTGGVSVCVYICVCPAIFGPVVQRPLYLQSELSSITRPAPVTQRLLNGPPCNDTHTHAHAQTHTCTVQRAEALWSAPRASPQRHACQQTGSDSAKPPGVTGGASTHTHTYRHTEQHNKCVGGGGVSKGGGGGR